MIYADASFLVACKVARDTFHKHALDFYEAEQERAWLWSPWHRVEVLNTIRQLTRHPESKRRLTVGEAKALTHRLETDVRLGYWTHMEADWRDVLRTANEISLAHAFSLTFSSADLLHVAYALELAAEVFVTFDVPQAALAKAAGLNTVNLADDLSGTP